MNVSGKLITTQEFQNNGILDITGVVDFPFGSSLANSTSGEIRINPNSMLQINSPLENSGTIINDGSFSVQSASVLNNTGMVRNNTHLELSGDLINESSLVNEDEIMIKSGGRLENSDSVSYTHLTLPTNREV